MKGGFDIKWFNWTSPVNFTGADDYGVFRFNNNIQAGGTGHPVANFLLGLPTDVDQTASGPNVDGVATHYGFFAQDEWRANSSVTLSLGLRYELRPPFEDREENISNFLRDTPNGDVVVPSRASIGLTAPGFAGSIGTLAHPRGRRDRLSQNRCASPTRTTSSRGSGSPGVRARDNRTVVRGGYGIYHARILGQVFNSLTGIHTSDNVTFLNAFDPPARAYSIVWPNTYAGRPEPRRHPRRHAELLHRQRSRYKDPMTQQWSATFERRARRPAGVPRHLLRLPQRRPDDGAGPEPDRSRTPSGSPTCRPRPDRSPTGTASTPATTAATRTTTTSSRSSAATLTRWGCRTPPPTSGRTRSTTSRIAAPASPTSRREINGRTDNRFDPDYLRGPTTNIPDHRFVSSLIWRCRWGVDGRSDRTCLSGSTPWRAGGRCRR